MDVIQISYSQVKEDQISIKRIFTLQISTSDNHLASLVARYNISSGFFKTIKLKAGSFKSYVISPRDWICQRKEIQYSQLLHNHQQED